MPESLTTRHTYSPESAGVIWGSRSLEPCTWEGGRSEGRAQSRVLGWWPGSYFLPWTPSGPSQGEARLMTLQSLCPRAGTGSNLPPPPHQGLQTLGTREKWGTAFADMLQGRWGCSMSSFGR